MQVLKFGGSSVKDASAMERVVEIVRGAIGRDKTILVASAIGGATDKLIEIGTLAAEGDESWTYEIDKLEARHLEIIDNLLPQDFRADTIAVENGLFEELRGVCKGVSLIREKSLYSNDKIMSFGELLSTKILYAKFQSLGISCRWLDSREYIFTELTGNGNQVLTDPTSAAAASLNRINTVKLLIMPGFIASDMQGRTTTLGRGGSDYTASLLAVGTEARRLEIWTDVDGMMTADPRIVPEAKTIEHISYKEALELSHFGAKVVYPPTIQPVVAKGIPILVKNTFDPEGPGTYIENNPPESSARIRGISGSSNIALLSMEGSGMVGIPGYSARLFAALAEKEINIILITQASSVHTMLVAISQKDSEKARKAADEAFAYEISLGKIEPLKVEPDFAIISLIGDDMKNQSGAGGRMFEAIGRCGISIRAIAQGSSERNVSAIVSHKDLDQAIRSIHEEFFGAAASRINLFVCGYGNVGKTLVSIIGEQAAEIFRNKAIDLRLVSVCNSKKVIFNRDGIEASKAGELLAATVPEVSGRSDDKFFENLINSHLSHSLFVDCTSDKIIAAKYADILGNGIGVVTCNKIANSSSQEYHDMIRTRGRGVTFNYETNVGAALPVIQFIDLLTSGGDRIDSIEAVVSGSLSYIFNNYDGSKPFVEVIRDAQEKGFTEPDPRTDLKGIDVLRKTIILAREVGCKLEVEDIKKGDILPADCLTGDLDEFYKHCLADEPYFKELSANASATHSKLRYASHISFKYDSSDGCAEKAEGRMTPKAECSIRLEAVPSDNPLYGLQGSSNIILIRSRDYPGGVTFTGSGAGARCTAAGLLADILRAR
jgi:aspartate kinase